MNAYIETIYRYQVVCQDCPFWSDEIESDDEAERVLAEHLREDHGLDTSVDAGPDGVHTLPLDGVHTPGVD